jgi:hypothetical protein
MRLFDFFKKKEELNYDYPFAVIMDTDPAMESFVNDKFNKVIKVFNNWQMFEKNKHSLRIPYTEEDAKNISEIWKIPVVELNQSFDFEYYQGENFGEVTQKILR